MERFRGGSREGRGQGEIVKAARGIGKGEGDWERERGGKGSRGG